MTRPLDFPTEGWEYFVRDDLVHLVQGNASDRALWPPVLEGYVEGEFGMQILLRTRVIRDAYYIAVIKSLDQSWPKIEKPGEYHADDDVMRRDVANGGRHPVLVLVPHAVEDNQTVVTNVEVLSVIGLAPLDGVDYVLRAYSQDWKRFCSEFGRITAKRKRQVVPSEGWGHDIPEKVVERRPQIVREIADDQTPLGVGLLANYGPVQIARSIRLRFGDGVIGLGFLVEEFIDLRIEIVKVMSCPTYTILGGQHG
jgi:hypothetical protein